MRWCRVKAGQRALVPCWVWWLAAGSRSICLSQRRSGTQNTWCPMQSSPEAEREAFRYAAITRVSYHVCMIIQPSLFCRHSKNVCFIVLWKTKNVKIDILISAKLLLYCIERCRNKCDWLEGWTLESFCNPIIELAYLSIKEIFNF